MTLAYDDADRRTSLTLPNTNSVTYAYNAASELTSLTYKQGATVIGDLTYTYDAAGNRTKVGGTFGRTTIPPALSTVSYNANNQQTTFGTNTETYDLNGNLSTVTDPSGTATYTWNARNQLMGISTVGFTASFSYDSFGRRTGKTVQGVTTNYVYDGVNPVQEKAGATVTANLLTGLGIDEFFTRTDGVGVRSHLPDAVGSTVALGDSTGTLQTQYTYEPFGYTTQTGQASTNSYKYTGREEDGTGLYYYRARYYYPRLQRFLSEDPIGFASGDFNLYAYVGGNSISRTDPSGLFSPLNHRWITNQALALNGIKNCPDLASQVVGADFLRGSQLPGNSYWHAMSDGTTGQTPQEAEKLYNSYVESNLASGTQEGLARALHAIQDSAAEGHKGFQPWSGGLPSWDHFLDDYWASQQSLAEAIQKTRDALNRIGGTCGCKKK